jgi:hypothetical protein
MESFLLGIATKLASGLLVDILVPVHAGFPKGTRA